LPLACRCELAGVARSTAYAPRRAAGPGPGELALLALIDAEYTRHPFYGSRKVVVYLRNLGYKVRFWFGLSRLALTGKASFATLKPEMHRLIAPTHRGHCH
jgi:putative transposase